MTLLLVLAALPVLAAAAYLAALALLAREGEPPASPATPHLRFDVVVPAHDEERGLPATVRSLFALDYPRALYRLLVVADNCRDATAEVAAHEGALVLVRNDAARRGKGYALAHAFERALADGFADAVVVVDADSIVSPNLLRAFAARFEAGAQALQAEYAVRNPDASWRTRLMTLALALFHGVRSLGREALGLSCGLRGNGMAFRTTLLREVGYGAFSVVEDMEYGVQLGHAGHAVRYVREARVLGEMAASEEVSRTQRRRWEGGRIQMARQHVPALLGRGLRERNLVLLDLALDLLVPPLTSLVLTVALGLGVTLLAWGLGHAGPAAPLTWGAAAAGILIYVVRGWVLSGTGVRGALDLLWAPVYVGWKLALWARGGGQAAGEWVRTRREGER